MSRFVKAEKALFYFLALTFFWQWRLVTVPAGQVFNEWTSFYFYATDLVISAIFILWVRRSLCKKIEISKSPLTPPKGGEGLPFFREGWGRFDSYENIALGIFLLFCTLSLFVASDKVLAFYRFIKLLEFVGLYFYVRCNFAAFYSLKKFWQWFVAGAALQSAVGIAQFLTQRSLGLKFFAESPLAPNLDGVAKIVVGGERIIRAYGLVPHPNILAAMLVMAIFGLAWLVLSDKSVIPAKAGIQAPPYQSDKSKHGFRLKAGMTQGMRTVLFVVIFALLSVALFFTFSRGIIIVGGILFLIWLAYLWREKEYRRRIYGILVLLFAISFLLLAIYWPYVSSRYDPATLPGSQSVDLRSFYNQEAIKMIWQKPLLGVGQSNFTVALRQAVSLPDWQYQPAHNIYLLVAAETGLAGLLAFLAFLILTIRSAWPYKNDFSVSCLLFTVVCLLIFGLFDHFLWDLQQGQILFWLAMGLLAGFWGKTRRVVKI